jgi:hypothetical protein
MAGDYEHVTRYPLVQIRWKDHTSEDSWMDGVEEALVSTAVNEVDTVGWLVHEDEETYLVTNNIATDGMQAMHMRLLKSTVISKDVLRAVKVKSEASPS